MSDDPFERWNLAPVINASGTMTSLGASRVQPETLALVDRILASGLSLTVSTLPASDRRRRRPQCDLLICRLSNLSFP